MSRQAHDIKSLQHSGSHFKKKKKKKSQNKGSALIYGLRASRDQTESCTR